VSLYENTFVILLLLNERNFSLFSLALLPFLTATNYFLYHKETERSVFPLLAPV